MRKKIIIFHPAMISGGTTTALIQFLKYLSSIDVDVDLFLLKKYGPYLADIPKNVRVIEARGIWQCYPFNKQQAKTIGRWFEFKYFWFRIWNKFFTTSSLSPFAIMFQKKLRKYDIAICYDHDIKTKTGFDDFILNKLKVDKKYIFVHTDFVKCNLGTVKNLKRDVKFDKIVTISESLKNQIKKTEPLLKDKVVCIKNLINDEGIINLSKEKCNIKVPNKINLLCVGRITSAKGYDRLVDISLHVIKFRKDFIWHIVGDGDYLEKLKDDIKKNGLQNYFVFYGFKKNPYKYMANVDYLVSLSYHEAYGLTMEETLICGTPVLAVNTLSAKEIVKNFGIVVDNKNSSVAEAIINLDINSLDNKIKYKCNNEETKAKIRKILEV